jgi:hypothetical protein
VNDWLERTDLEVTGPQWTDIIAAVKEFALANKRLLARDGFATIAEALIDGEEA